MSERKKKGVGVLKIVFGLAVVGIALVAVLVGIVVVSIDTIAKQGVERGATYALQVPTTLDKADVGIMSGTFSMSGLQVNNPEGFTAPHFLQMNDAGVAVSLETLGEDVIELPELTITGIDMYLVKEGGKANYQVIMDNLKRFEGEGKKEPDPSKPGKKFVIRKIDMKNIKVHATLLPVGGAANTVDVDIPEIVLTNVGSGGQSVSMAELVNVIIKAVFATAVNLGGALPGEITEGLKGGLAELGSLGEMGVGVAANIGGQVIGVAGDATKMLGEVGEGAGKAVEDATKGLEEGVKGLFGGGDKKKDE